MAFPWIIICPEIEEDFEEDTEIIEPLELPEEEPIPVEGWPVQVPEYA